MWYCNRCNICLNCNTKFTLGKSICCDLGKHWFHGHCAKVKNSFTKLSQSDKQWNCRDCLRDGFPFYELDNKTKKISHSTARRTNSEQNSKRIP